MGRIITEDDVKKGVVQRLNYWQGLGVVLNWERINCGRVQHFGNWFYGAKAGFPDYFAEVIKDKLIYICYFELKRPSVKELREEQRIFKEKHEGFTNVSFDLVNDPVIVDNRIELITNYSYNKLQEADNYLWNIKN